MVGLPGRAGLGGGGAQGGILLMVLLPGLVCLLSLLSVSCQTSTMVAVVRALLVAKWVVEYVAR